MTRTLRNFSSWLLFLLFISIAPTAQSQSKGVWKGDKMTFTKANSATWTNAANQDRINDTCWLTRANDRGLFNIRVESSYSNNLSPRNTKWAYGTTSNLSSLTFNDWERTNNSSPPSMVNKDMVLLIVSDSIYIDIKFTKWTAGGGGGFEYVRATDCRSFETLTTASCDSFISPSKKVWKQSGTYYDTIQNTAGCDSVIKINLTVYNQTTQKKFFSGCGQVTLPFSKRVITASGTYNDTLPKGTICGYDSILIASVYIYPVPQKTVNMVACDSAKSPSGKFTWTKSGTYTDVLKATASCDTTVTVNLTINSSKITQIVEESCDQFVSATNNVYIASGMYKDTLQTATGCDSVIELDLTIHNSTLTKLNPSVCRVSYTSPSGKYVYGTSGTYLDTLTSVHGCDSVIEMNLTINPLTSVEPVTSCSDWASPSGKFVYTQSGTYYDTLSTVDMTCDSVVQIDFKKIEPSSATITIPAAINRYHSPSGRYTWTTNGTYNDTIPNQAGCDSVMTFNLTVQSISLDVTKNDDVLTAVATGVNYQWLDCNDNFSEVNGETSQSFTVTKKGLYAVQLSNQYNADTSACVEMNLSLDQINAFGIQLYPNPNTGNFYLSLGDVAVKVTNIQIVDANGNVVYETSKISKEVEIQMTNHASGIYFLRVLAEDFTYNTRVVLY